MECIIHYTGYEKYSALKKLSSINVERIEKAKAKRETYSDTICVINII